MPDVREIGSFIYLLSTPYCRSNYDPPIERAYAFLLHYKEVNAIEHDKAYR